MVKYIAMLIIFVSATAAGQMLYADSDSGSSCKNLYNHRVCLKSPLAFMTPERFFSRLLPQLKERGAIAKVGSQSIADNVEGFDPFFQNALRRDLRQIHIVLSDIRTYEYEDNPDNIYYPLNFARLRGCEKEFNDAELGEVFKCVVPKAGKDVVDLWRKNDLDVFSSTHIAVCRTITVQATERPSVPISSCDIRVEKKNVYASFSIPYRQIELFNDVISFVTSRIIIEEILPN